MKQIHRVELNIELSDLDGISESFVVLLDFANLIGHISLVNLKKKTAKLASHRLCLGVMRRS